MLKQEIEPSQHLHGFTVERVEEISELRSQAVILRHEKTGARLLHLYNDDPNNLFCIAFRTPVYDSTGVPHILEHSVLCGSRKFPIKDPFQELLKGSLQTFLNAMTYPDKTIYPVSSQVEVDFFNLVDVYCDAVLHPLLTKNTLAQEGWHFDVEDPYGPVNIKGIVYNEMKGVFSNFSSHVARKTMSGLFPDNTYFYESGGEPDHITDLTYEQFKAFHSKYYHPSNSFTFLHGNIPTEKSLRFLEEKYLHEYERLEVDSEVKPQPLWASPRQMEIEAPAPEEEDGTATVNVSWILGDSTDPVNSLLGFVLSRYLVGTESSPLKRALIDSGLGEDLDDITGFDSDTIQSVFASGLRKSRPEHAEKIKALVFDTLKKEVEKGLDEELLEGTLRRMEFKLREISGNGHFPYNLKLADRCYRSWLYGGDPLAHLKFEESLNFLKSEKAARGTKFFEEKIKELLMENSHQLLTIVKASFEMSKRLEKRTQQQARELSKDFGQKEKRKFHKITLRLLEEQKTPVSPEKLATLPKLSKSDLPPKEIEVPTEQSVLSGVPLYSHPLFTSGIVYLDMGFDCSSVPGRLLPYLPLYTELLTSCGAAGLSYQEMSKRVSLSTGGLDSAIMCDTRLGSESDLLFKCFVQGKALPERVPEMLEIFSDLFMKPDLENTKQIKDMIFEMRNDLNGSVISSGHLFAVSHAASRMSRCGYMEETMNGVSQLRFLDRLLKEDKIDEVVERMKELHAMLINKNTCLLSMTADHPEEFTKPLESFVDCLPVLELTASESAMDLESDPNTFGIEISASVNYVSKAWNTGRKTHEDMGQCALLAKNLSTGYLWDKVRVEGGAYGGMAMAKGTEPLFHCASYRDPNLSRTLENFEKALLGVAKGLDQSKVDQSIIGTIGSMDKPKTPRSKGFGETLSLLNGLTKEFRQSLRESVLNASSETLKEMAQKILDSRDTAVTVFGSTSAFDNAQKEGVELKRESLMK